MQAHSGGLAARPSAPQILRALEVLGNRPQANAADCLWRDGQLRSSGSKRHPKNEPFHGSAFAQQSCHNNGHFRASAGVRHMLITKLVVPQLIIANQFGYATVFLFMS